VQQGPSLVQTLACEHGKPSAQARQGVQIAGCFIRYSIRFELPVEEKAIDK
jgi:hypothetical protein